MRTYKKKHKQQQQMAMASSNIMAANPMQLSAIQWQIIQQQAVQQPVAFFDPNLVQNKPENHYTNVASMNNFQQILPNGASGFANPAYDDDIEKAKAIAADDLDIETNKLNEFRQHYVEPTYATHIDQKGDIK